MNLNKYKDHLFQSIKQTLERWLDAGREETIDDQEVYRFLHSLKGTGGTLQLGGLMQIASSLLEQQESRGCHEWQPSELRSFLFGLIELAYEYEHFNELDFKEEPVRDTHAPLIQIIDDDVSMLIFLKDILEEQGWMVITNTDSEKAAELYFEVQPDCLIIDVQLPERSGFQILDDIQQHNEKYFIPKIMISINNDKETRLKAYRTGADDYITKPIDVEEFLVKMERHLQRKKIFDQSALIDELTQVYNRRFFEESLKRQLNDMKRTNQPFSLGVLDLDHFKNINDKYGHLMGDKVLIEFASFLKENLRSTDTVYRYGGEEFVVIFPRTAAAEVESRLTELIGSFSKIAFSFKENERFHVTFSAGVYTVENDLVTPETAFKRADQLLYAAKGLGRAQAVYAGKGCELFTRKKMAVSVVDDDVLIRSMLVKMLETLDISHLDLQIRAFESGRDFLDSLKHGEESGHFLILDGVMPGMDGLEVLQEVKRRPGGETFTVLMLTGRKSEQDIARALRLGADDYVVKPFSVPELKHRMEILLKHMK